MKKFKGEKKGNKFKYKFKYYQKKRNKLKPLEGIAYIQSSLNNTIITITNLEGDVLGWSSAGTSGLKGFKKETPLGAKKAAEAVAYFCLKKGIRKLYVRIKGIGFGREAALRSLRGPGISFKTISDITPYSHNGCRPPKKRRL
uniref:ribosomal protein S11 n=1 Tax=Prototheca fontanea TaxID=2836215 RepID=UPI003001FB4E